MRPALLALAATLLASRQDPPPDIAGVIRSAFVDGASALLVIAVEGGPADGVTVYVRPATKVDYVDLPRAERRPASGLYAQVWLLPGSRDAASRIRLLREKPPPPPFPARPVGPEVTLEAEEFALRGVKAWEFPGAPGEKALLFLFAGDRAETTVVLRQGRYEVRVLMQGLDTNHDSVLVTVAGREQRFTQDSWGRLAPGKVHDVPRPTVDVPRDGEHRVALAFDESHVWVDRVVLVRVVAPVPPDAEGFIRDWLVLGPIPPERPGDAAGELDRPALDDEHLATPKDGERVTVRGRELAWRLHSAPQYYVDFSTLLETSAGATAYAVCAVQADAERRDLRVRMGANDIGKLHLNGFEVVRQAAKKGEVKDAGAPVEVTLRRGWNLLVLKVVNAGGRWQGCVRFVDASDRPARDLRVGPP